MPAILGIILLAIVLYLYYLLIHWLFASVGPGFMYITSLLFSIAVPTVYVRVQLMTFGRTPGAGSTARNWLFVVVVALVALIHIDLLWISLGYGLTLLHVPFAGELHELLGHIVHGAVVNREAMRLASTVLPDTAGELEYLLCSSAMKSALIVPCVLWVRGFSSAIVNPRQPAFVSYFHGQALRDLGAVIKRMAVDLTTLVLLANSGIVKVTVVGSIFVWPLTIMTYIALLPPIVIAVAASLLLVAMHSLALGLIWLLAMVVSFLLAVTERAVVLSRAGYAKCPHAECHAPVPLPIFMCPECGEGHDRLLPGRFGVFKRACKCGVGRLPTLFWHGKGRLRSVCPSCRRPMREELFGGSIHVPIYGGPSTGKTMYMMAATWELLERKVSGVRARLIDEAIDRAYKNRWKPDFESGRVREKTVNPFPDAFLLAMQRGAGLPTSVYLYDPAGEAMQNESALDAHRFMNYLDGLALLIDPLSLPSFAARYRESGGPDLSQTTSRSHPEETVNRMVNLLERLGKLSRKRSSSQRVAVVFTKADVLGFSQEVGIGIEDSADMQGDWKKFGAHDSSRLREWLAENEPHLLQILEFHFAEIRYFAVSALGHSPQTGKGFSPRKVMEPLGWLLARRSTFARPLLGRIMGRAMEAGAVLAVLCCFVVLPIWALLWWRF